jgi:hypothetical protein
MADTLTAYKPAMLDRYRTHRRVLWGAPVAIFVLWLAGIASYRAWSIPAGQHVVLLTLLLSAKLVCGWVLPARPRFVLPMGRNLLSLTLQVGIITAVVGLILGGIVEAGVPHSDPGYGTPWLLRTFWHGACAFGASYASFLGRHLPRPRSLRMHAV